MRPLFALAQAFHSRYDDASEQAALMQRDAFLERFPLSRLPQMKLGDYAIGQNDGHTFSHWIEVGTRDWAPPHRTTVRKFGVYFSKGRQDPDGRYRYLRKFASGLPLLGAEEEAFKNVRAALHDLTMAGRLQSSKDVDANPLAQMLKAKILSLYFPELYLPICGGHALSWVASALRIDSQSPSWVQRAALAAKDRHPLFKGWSQLKFAAFLNHLLSVATANELSSAPSSFKDSLGSGRAPTSSAEGNSGVDFEAEELMTLEGEGGKE